jgi:hypothetical protein
VFQPTRQLISEQLNSFRESKSLPFRDVLDADMVNDALVAEGVKFHNCIYTPLTTLCLFLSQVLDPDHSCRAAVGRLIAWLAADDRDSSSPQTNTYCDARQRLPLGVITRLVRRTARKIEDRARREWLWKGRTVVLVDGTTASMPDTPKNQQDFPHAPLQGNAPGFPIARMVAIISLATGVLRDLALGPYLGKKTGEPALFRSLWNTLRKGEIVLGDRCFCSYFEIAGLLQRGVDVVVRMHQKRGFDFRRGKRIGTDDHIVTWRRPPKPDWMDAETHARMPKKLRIRELRIKVKDRGCRVKELVLVATLLDARVHTLKDIAGLYMKRWNIELDLRSIKDVMQMDILRCKTPEMVRKEIWMHLLAYNVIRGVMAEAAEAHKTQPRQVSFKGALQTMTAFQDALRQATPETRDDLLKTMLKAIASHRVGNRPGRVEPRKNKRRKKTMSHLNEPRPEARKRLVQRA